MSDYITLGKNDKGQFGGAFIAPIKHFDRDHVTVYCRLLTVGKYTDMNGKQVEISRKILNTLTKKYNLEFKRAYEEYRLSAESHMSETLKSPIAIEDWGFLPNQLNHEAADATKTVGRVVGEMEVKFCKAVKDYAIFATIKVSHHHNVFYVCNDLWRYLSVGFDLDKLEFREVSWVTYGADPRAYKMLGAHQMATEPIDKSIVKISDEDKELIQLAYSEIKRLKKQIVINDGLVFLCKKRKIKKSDTFDLSARLNKIDDLESVRICLSIMNELIPVETEAVFYPMEKKGMDTFLEKMNSSPRMSYQSK